MAEPNERGSNASGVDIREFVIAREFDAPRDLVWKAWTEQDRLMQWFGEHDGKTTVTLHWLPISATASERTTFDAGREGMKMGWTGTFDQLAGYLAKERSR